MLLLSSKHKPVIAHTTNKHLSETIQLYNSMKYDSDMMGKMANLIILKKRLFAPLVEILSMYPG